MIFNKTVIRALEAEIPPLEMTSQQLEQELSPVYERLKLPEGRLELMSGVQSRRYWESGTKPSDISTKAAKRLFKQHSIDPQSIDLLIHSAVCRDFLEPSTASVVHQNLNLSQKCMIFDLSNACLGMLNSMVIAAEMIERGSIKNALIVSGENSAPLIEQTVKRLNNDLSLSRKDIKKFFANLTIGSCGMAILLTNEEDHSPHNLLKLKHASVLTDTRANHLCRGDGDSHSLMMETNSEELMKYGVELAKENWKEFLKESPYTSDDYQSVFCHQVGSAHEALTLSSLNLQNKLTHRTYPHLGNTGSCALPVTIWEAYQKYNTSLKQTQSALLGIGSGLTSIMMGVQWI